MPPFKFSNAIGLKADFVRPSSSDLGMHLLSNLGRSLLAMATKSTKLTPTGVRHWPASTLASPDCSPGASANLPARDLPKFNKRYLGTARRQPGLSLPNPSPSGAVHYQGILLKGLCTPLKAQPIRTSSRLTYAARGSARCQLLDKRKWLLSEVGWQTSSIKPPP